MPRENILTEITDGIATLTIDRAEKRNCIDLPMWIALGEAMERFSADESLRCVIIRGAGDQAFSAGADISDMQPGGAGSDPGYGPALKKSLASIEGCIHPVVAAISGWCMGGAAGVATMADFRLANEGMKFGIPARNLGIWYAHAWLDPILQMAGYATCCELLIEGKIFDGREALAKGLITHCVPDGSVFTEAEALARRIAAGAPLSNRFHKRALKALRGPMPVSAEALLAETRYRETEDFRGAVQAFMEKRKPVFAGR